MRFGSTSNGRDFFGFRVYTLRLGDEKAEGTEVVEGLVKGLHEVAVGFCEGAGKRYVRGMQVGRAGPEGGGYGRGEGASLS